MEKEKQFKAKFLGLTEIGEGTLEATFELQNHINYKPGQYAWLILDNQLVSDTRGNIRGFSLLFDNDNPGIFRIIYRDGISGFKQALKKISPGTQLVWSGPFGSFVLPSKLNQPLVFIAGGTGVVPVMALTRELCHRQENMKVEIIVGNSQASREVGRLEIEQLQKKHKNIHAHFFQGEIDSGWLKGVNFPESLFYLAGPLGFVWQTGSLLEQAGVKLENMRFDQYFFTNSRVSSSALPNNISGLNIEVFKQAVDNALSHIIITDPDGLIVYANQAASNITGYSQEEMLGQTPRLWGGLMDESLYRTFWHKIKNELTPFEGQFTNRRKNQELYLARAKVSPILNPQGKLLGFMGTEEDITQKVAIEQELTSTRNFYNSIIENLPDMVFVKDAQDLKFVLFNKAGEDLLGVDRQDMMGKNDHDFFPPSQADFFEKKDREVINSGKLQIIPEEKILTKKQGERVLRTKKVLLVDGRNQYLLGISEDVTEDKRQEREILKQKADLERINKVMVDRELKMIQLKQEILDLKNKLKISETE